MLSYHIGTLNDNALFDEVWLFLYNMIIKMKSH